MKLSYSPSAAESAKLLHHGLANHLRCRALARLTKKPVTVLGTARFGIVYDGPCNYWVWARDFTRFGDYPAGDEKIFRSQNWTPPQELRAHLMSRANTLRKLGHIVIITD